MAFATSLFGRQTARSARRTWQSTAQSRRCLQASALSKKVPDFAFAFDIDGVLVRSSKPIKKASETLASLQRNRIPFILLTNGGGRTEADRVADLSDKLNVELDTSMIVQSHSPFADMKEYHDKTVLIVGGDRDKCANVARGYGFNNVVTPADILVSHPDIWPFSHVFLDYYKSFAQPLPRPIHASDPSQSLKIDAIFVYNDPRDWALDSTIILDLLLSKQGILGTLSDKNGKTDLPNNGYLQDSQPRIYYSNPDLWWAASHPLPRLGQGGFQEAFSGLWQTVSNGAKLDTTTIGKPHQPTYEFAEKKLRAHRKQLFGSIGLNDPLRRVFMIGDNTESDIKGANNYQSPFGSTWTSILVRTGVYSGGKPNVQPKHIADDVSEAVEWALEEADWKS